MSETSRTSAVLEASQITATGHADVARIQARSRQRRQVRLAVILGISLGYLAYRYLSGNPLGAPKLGPDWIYWLPPMVLVLALAAVMLLPLANGRSPHVLIHPDQIEVGLRDIKGLDTQADEVSRTLDVFLGYATFRDQLGGNPRRGILFEGPPGTGKTYLAKAMAKEAGVPFLFVSAPAFQSMWFGMTASKIRRFFKMLRKAARREGGAIGFIEEIDAIGVTRGGLNSVVPRPPQQAQGFGGLGRSVTPMVAPGTGGMVNELLIQLQSFDQPRFRERLWARLIDAVNYYLPEGKRLRAARPPYHNILLIAATNRADNLDPALLRPGRFDRRLYFDLPTKSARRDLIDFFLDRKAHHEQLDEDPARDQLAHDTLGYTPVSIEHLFDEALLVALRQGRNRMTINDVYEAKLTEEIGVKQAVVYTDLDRKAVATHEAGHATAAYFLGRGRRLEVLSIIKRRESLGLLAHGDLEERFTRSRSELEAALGIALGGLVSEELFLGETGTGPAADLAVATGIAATMVGALGMAGSLISFEAVNEGPLASVNLAGKVLSDSDGKRAVEEILEAERRKVGTCLEENRDVVMALRDALTERDELVGDQIVQVIEDALVERKQKRERLIVLPDLEPDTSE